MTRKASKPIWPKVPAGFVRSCLAGHSVVGLTMAALAYLVCVTGTLVVFVDELRRWEQPGVPESPTISAEAVGRAAEAAIARAEPEPVRFVTLTLPSPDVPRTVVAVTAEGEPEAWYVEPDGVLATPKRSTWTDFASELHIKLHMKGLWGYLIVGLAGVGMLALAVSGVLAHPRIFRDAFKLRWGGSKRLQEADLHNRLSVWGLPFNIAISVTGAYFGLVGVLVMAVAATAYDGDRSRPAAAVRAPVVAPDPAPAPRPDLAAVISHVRVSTDVDDEPFSVSVARPGTRGQSTTVYSRVRDRMVYGELYQFSGTSLSPTKVGWSDGPFGVQLYATAYPLHFGDFGGLPVKVLYFLLGLGLSVVCSSGVAIWLARRRDQGRPAPLWEKMWAATAWGVPIALAISAVAVLGFELPPLPVFVLSVVAAYAAGAIAANAEALSSALKLVLAATLAAVVALHLGRNGAAALAPIAASVDLALLLTALGLTAWVVRRSPRPTSAPTSA